jgi:hypothetical protein
MPPESSRLFPAALLGPAFVLAVFPPAALLIVVKTSLEVVALSGNVRTNPEAAGFVADAEPSATGDTFA